MKYIDAEKLKAEITRLKGQLIRGACASQTEMETNCKDEAYNEVLAIITSLQQEQPGNICPRCVYRNKTDDLCEYPYGGRICRIDKNGVYECNGFEEIGRQEQPNGFDDTPTSPDFDTEVYNWLKQHGSDETRQLIEMTARHFWGMGRRDERIEMMKDVVDGFITTNHFNRYIVVPKLDESLTYGDNVKVIILKTEDEK